MCRAAPAPRVGLRCLGFRELVCTGNILDVGIPFDHDNRDWHDQHYLVKDNVIICGRSLGNGAPADKHREVSQVAEQEVVVGKWNNKVSFVVELTGAFPALHSQAVWRRLRCDS